ncbi:hypothetical protein Tcan_00119 [Toxocara canis]|nr:hypothetical protein Tcan_00119 [Toxocara canis]
MLALLVALISSSSATALQCYSCVSSLPASTPIDAQHALKTILYSAYNLPPVSRSCADSEDTYFKTVSQTDCPPGDHCMKISVKEQGLIFVMRGCQSALYRNGVTITRVECNNNKSPSICRCSESLCNSSFSNRISYFVFVFLFVFNTLTFIVSLVNAI